jgi:hypothetical protein
MLCNGAFCATGGMFPNALVFAVIVHHLPNTSRSRRSAGAMYDGNVVLTKCMPEFVLAEPRFSVDDNLVWDIHLQGHRAVLIAVVPILPYCTQQTVRTYCSDRVSSWRIRCWGTLY